MEETREPLVCRNCGGSVPESAPVCPQCGASLEGMAKTPSFGESQEYACADCGAAVSPGDRVCPQCGGSLEWTSESTPSLEAAAQAVPAAAVRVMKLGDIFDRTFSLIGKMFKRSVPIILVLMVPMSVLVVAASREFYASISDTAGNESLEAAARGWTFLRAMSLVGLAALAVFLATMAGGLAITRLTHSEFTGGLMTWKEALRSVLGIRLLRGLGVVILETLAVGGILLCLIMFFVVSPALGVLMLLLAAALVAFLLIRWSFAFTTVACEDVTTTEAFGRSWFLVREHWWRIFGILFLLSFLLNFAIALVTTPVTVIASWGFYVEYFKMLGSIGHGEPDPAKMLHAMRPMGIGVGLSFCLNLMLQTLVQPVYTTLLYLDLRARKNELTPPQPVLPVDSKDTPPEPAPEENPASG